MQNALNIIVAASLYSLMAAGFTLILKANGFFHLAHGGVYALGGYVAYVASGAFGWPSWLLFSTLAGSLVGLGVDRLVYRQLRFRQVGPLAFLLASFGVYLTIESCLQLYWGARSLSIVRDEATVGSWFGVRVTFGQIRLIGASIVTLPLLWAVLRWTEIGLRIRAVAESRTSSELVGINTECSLAVTFALGSALAAMAGALGGYEGNVVPTMGLLAVLKGIVAAVAGRVGSIPGAVLGSVLLASLEQLTVHLFGGEWKDTVAFVLLMVLMWFLPKGLLGLREAY